LFAFFKETVVDLESKEPSRDLFILRSEVDRGDERAVLKALRKQYLGCLFTFVRSPSWAGYVNTIPSPENLKKDEP